MEEFQEIYLSGGKIEFKKGKNGGVSIGYKGSNPWAMAMFQVCVSFDGVVLDIVPFTGLGQPMPPYPQPSLLAWLISDRLGMFGCRCPNCKSYFRIDMYLSNIYCPHCGEISKGTQFLTENQLKYVHAFCNAFIDAYEGDEDVTLDLDRLNDELPENKPKWLYSEETQQNNYKCLGCKRKYNILGEYGLCPGCGKPNLHDIFTQKLNEFEEQFQKANEEVIDRHDREVEWEKLTRCVSEFESMANQVRRFMLRFPVTEKRKNSLKSLSFQNILIARERLKEWYDIDILEGVLDTDRQFLNKMFNRRHLFTHNAGQVDQEYLNNTGDTSVRLNQVIRVKSKEIRRLIPLIKTCGQKLIKGYESIQ